MPTPASDERNPNHWPSTAWTLLQCAQNPADPARGEHRNRFLVRYWRPVFVFLRSRGYPTPRAEELTQAFFLHLLETSGLRQADPARGKFRSYLLGALKHFLADHTPDRLPRQEAFEQALGPLDSPLSDEDRCYEPPGGKPADVLFMRQYAVDLVRAVRQRMRQHWIRCGKPWVYEVFAALYPEDSGGPPRPTQDGLAARLRVTRDQVRYAQKRAEKTFRVLLRAELHDQVGRVEDIADEIRELLLLLGS